MPINVNGWGSTSILVPLIRYLQIIRGEMYGQQVFNAGILYRNVKEVLES